MTIKAVRKISEGMTPSCQYILYIQNMHMTHQIHWQDTAAACGTHLGYGGKETAALLGAFATTMAFAG